MFSTDALIITKLFGPETLASYSLVVKLFGGIQIIWGAILGPLWPAIAHALSSRDSKWVQDSVKPLAQAFTGFVTVSILLYFCIPFIIFHWVGEIKIPDLVPEVLLAQTILQGFNAILASYMYAADRVWLVARTGVFSGAINIPLSIFFATSLGFGVAGVVLGTLVSMSVFTFIGSRLFMSDLRKKFEI
jgi:O-antigen/teichoic acid export membrane protein